MMFIAITVALEMNIALLLKISFVLSGPRGNILIPDEQETIQAQMHAHTHAQKHIHRLRS